MDHDDFPTGDPRRCPTHPRVKTSSDDGMFDAPCGECEYESYMQEELDDFGGDICDPALWDLMGDPCEDDDPVPEDDSMGRPVVARRMGRPLYADDFDDGCPF